LTKHCPWLNPLTHKYVVTVRLPVMRIAPTDRAVAVPTQAPEARAPHRDFRYHTISQSVTQYTLSISRKLGTDIALPA